VRLVSDHGMRAAAFPTSQEASTALRTARERGDPYQFAIVDGAANAAALQTDPAAAGTLLVALAPLGQNIPGRSLTKPVRQSQLLEELAAAWTEHKETARTKKAAVRPEISRRIEDMKAVLDEKFGASTVRVLIAEDNVVNQKVAARMVTRLGFRADVAANGREAVEMFDMLPYDLIFMDCQMPEMDGYEAARTIRKREQSSRRVAIVAMTADVLTGCRDRCIAAGMDDHVAKPVKMDDVFEALHKWVPLKV
jgi:two-component system sensor histidine kinase/response regulator